MTTSATLFQANALSDNPRDWKGEIGLMNSQSTSVVFTLETLTNWLKTLQIEVDANLSEFKNLPKFAQLGKMTAGSPPEPAAPASPTQASQNASEASTTAHMPKVQPSSPALVLDQQATTRAAQQPISAQPATGPAGAALPSSSKPQPDIMVSPIEGFIPTRRVRQPIGGGSAGITAIFGGYEKEEGQRETENPPSASRRAVSNPVMSERESGKSSNPATSQPNVSPIPDFIPTRRVRQLPGGGSAQISAIFG